MAKSSASGVGINEYVLQPDGTSTTVASSVAVIVGVSVGAGWVAVGLGRVAVGLGGVVGVAVAGGGVALLAQALALSATSSTANPITGDSVRFCMMVSWFTIFPHFTSKESVPDEREIMINSRRDETLSLLTVFGGLPVI